MKGLLLSIFFAVFLIACNTNEKYYQGYVEGENVYLASPYSGRLQYLYVHRGQYVKKGQLLFALDPNPQAFLVKQQEAALLQAQQLLSDLEQPRRLPEVQAIRAQIEQTDAKLKLAEIRVKRMQELYLKQATDKDSLDAAIAYYKEQEKLKAQYQSNLELAQLGSRVEQIKAQRSQVVSTRAKLNEAKWQLTQKKIYSPTEGIIFDTYYREGEFVEGQHAVLSLLPPQNKRIEFFVPTSEVNYLRLGKSITFFREESKTTYNAIVDYVSPEAEYLPPLVYSRENYTKLVFRVKARIVKPDTFKPGQPVTVEIAHG